MQFLMFFVLLSSSLFYTIGNCASDLANGSYLRTIQPRAYTTTCTNVFDTVCSDCSTLWTCLGKDKPALSQKCSSVYPGQPYCVDGTCSSVRDPDSADCTTGITCTTDGYFPNPSNCSQYYFCTAANGASDIYECPTGFVYNPVTQGCKRRTNNADCITINCAANKNLFVVYPGDRAYYALCFQDENGLLNPVMFRCADANNYAYDQSLRKCVFNCKAEGRVADSNNCKKYYECYRIGNNYISNAYTCPGNYIFNDTTKRCVVGTCPNDTPPPSQQDPVAQ